MRGTDKSRMTCRTPCHPPWLQNRHTESRVSCGLVWRSVSGTTLEIAVTLLPPSFPPQLSFVCSSSSLSYYLIFSHLIYAFPWMKNTYKEISHNDTLRFFCQSNRCIVSSVINFSIVMIHLYQVCFSKIN